MSSPPGLLPTVTTLLPLLTSAARTFFHLTPSFATSLDSAAGISPTVQHTYSSPSSPIFVIASTGSHNSCLSPIPPQPSAQETQQNEESRLRGADVAALVIGVVIVGLLTGVAATCLYIRRRCHHRLRRSEHQRAIRAQHSKRRQTQAGWHTPRENVSRQTRTMKGIDGCIERTHDELGF